MFYREGMNGIILLLTLFAVLLFVIVIRFSIIPIQVDQGTLGIVLSMGLILLVQFVYAFFVTKHRKEAFVFTVGDIGFDPDFHRTQYLVQGKF